MTSATTQTGLTVRTFLLGSGPEDDTTRIRQIPGRQDVVQLGMHRITSAHNPTVELLVDGVKVHTFRFQFTVIFDIDVAALVIRDGLLTALKAGDGAVT